MAAPLSPAERDALRYWRGRADEQGRVHIGVLHRGFAPRLVRELRRKGYLEPCRLPDGGEDAYRYQIAAEPAEAPPQRGAGARPRVGRAQRRRRSAEPGRET